VGLVSGPEFLLPQNFQSVVGFGVVHCCPNATLADESYDVVTDVDVFIQDATIGHTGQLAVDNPD